MAVRNESVRLSLDDQFTSGMARATAATALFKRELNELDGKRVSTDLDAASKGVDKVGSSSRRAGPEIDKLSGRLRLIMDSAVILGPALVRLGAGAIPVLTGSIAGLGAAAGGLGVTIAAFTGLGDALDALNDYQLEPTAENLEKLRIEQEKLGPSGVQFMNYLDSLGPVLRDLQQTTRDGIFPGVEDGIDALLERLPQLRQIIADISEGVGSIASRAGESLGGDDFNAFFDYLETDARPTLESFANSLGNVALGVANMLVAFAPASRDFTSGLEEMTERFADWTAGLGDNQSFQEFLAYVREAGPEAAQFVAAIAKAMAGLLEAAAPLGSVLLPALSALANAFAAIAGSPFGPAIYAGVAGFIALNRAVGPAQRGLDLFGRSSDKTVTSLGRMAKLGGGVLAVGTAVGALADNIDRIDAGNLERSLEALKLGDVTGEIPKVIDSIADLESKWNSIDLGEVFTLGGVFGDSTLDKLAKNVDQVDQSLAQLVESGNAAEAATLFQKVSDLAQAKGVSPTDTAKLFDAYALALDNVSASSTDASSASGFFAGAVGEVSGQLKTAANSAEAFSGALSNLNGWLDKREALRSYRDGIKDLSKGLKDGFGRADVENIDAVGRNIAQVASLIKDRGLRADFLAGARQSLVEMANGAGRKARAEIEELIGALDRYGLTKPKKPPLEVDDKATPTLNALGIKLRKHGNTKESAKAEVDPGNSFNVLGSIQSGLNALRDKSITITTIRKTVGAAVGNISPWGTDSADGSTVPKSGRGYADRFPYMLADGEEVISNRYGQADRHRSLLKAINANRLADGGTTGGLVQNTYTSRRDSDPDEDKAGKDQDRKTRHTVTLFLEGMTGATHGFKALQKVLKAEEEQRKKAFDRAKSARDEAIGRRDALAGSISSGLAGDIWADREASDNPWMAGATAGGKATPASALAALQKQRADTQRFLVALNTLKQKGITGPVLAEIIGTGDVDRAEMMAALPIEELTSFASVYTAAQGELAAAGLAGGNALEGQNIKVLEKELRGARQELREIRQAINNSAAKHEQAVDKAADKTGDKVGDKVNGGATKGRRNKVYASR